jgi:Tol biopolymer transport system component
VSPDGKLVAWVSDESGRREVYAARLGDQGTRRRLTNTGGDEPRWNRQGTRLFYVTAPGIESVALRSSADVSFGDPELVTRSAGTDRLIGYDVAADGTSVVFSAVGGMRDSPRDIRLWRGWGETVKDVR